MGDLLKTVKGKLDPYVVTSLQKRFRSAEKQKIEVRKIGKTKLMITTDKQTASLEFLGRADGSETRTAFLINGKEFEFDNQLSPEDNIRSLVKVLPKRVSMMDLIFPQAYADDDLTAMFGMAMMATMFTTMIMNQNQYSCGSWSYGCGYGYAQPWTQPMRYYAVQPQVTYAPQVIYPQQLSYPGYGGGAYGYGTTTGYGGYGIPTALPILSTVRASTSTAQ